MSKAPIRVNEYGQYISGAQNALLVVKDLLTRFGKPGDRPYIMAEINLALSDVRNVERFLMQEDIGFRNHKKKGTKIESVEAYYLKDYE